MLFCVLSATSIFSLTWRSFSEEQLPFNDDKRQKKNRRTEKTTTTTKNSAMVYHSNITSCFASLLSMTSHQIFSNKIEVCVIIPLIRPPRERKLLIRIKMVFKAFCRDESQLKLEDISEECFYPYQPKRKNI